MSVRDSQQNIRVAVRCRPINKQELEKCARSCVECSREKVTVRDKSTSKVFTFDHVFNQYSKQIDVYKTMVAPMIDEIIMGYNCTIFAYGQTGSGKTFTMTGERSDKLRYEWETDPLAGIIPRALSHLFEILQSNGSDFSVRVSFLEVYNEELFDLLSAAEDVARLTIYDDINRKGSVIVKGLREVVVLDKDDVYSVIERGLARRQTATTLLNAQSSRSHSIFTVTVHIKETNAITSEELLRIGKLHLVDLAGSENVGRSGAVEKRAREAGSINQSLLTLGRVITSLVEHAPHIPYRESKLTRLLQDSLGGRTKTSIIATISPVMTNIEETLSTLDYAHRAKNIENRPEINARLNKTDLVRGYNEELERLRRDLEAARTKNGIFVNEENYQVLQSQLAQQRSRICELEERREILEEEIVQVQELFTVTQEELSETRMRKEEVENELIAYQKDLENLRVRFLKLKLRYEETDYLREEHKKTESLLHEQAKSLLSTTDSAISDVNGLHQKLIRLSDLDKENRERLNTLHSSWLPDRLTPMTRDLSTLAAQVKDFCCFVQNSTSSLKEKLTLSTCNAVKVQREMVQKLRTFLADEYVTAADQINSFSKEQATEAKAGCDAIIIPQFKCLQTLVTSLSTGADDLDRCLVDQLNAYQASSQELDHAIKQINHLTALSSGFVNSEMEHDKEIQNQMVSYRTQCGKLLSELELITNQMKKLTTTHDSQISKELSSRSSRLTEFSRSSQSEVEKLKSSLSNKQETILNDVCEAHNFNMSSINRLKELTNTISHDHENLKEEVENCINNICKGADRFATNGLGSDLLKKASIWQSSDQDHSDYNTFDHTIKMERIISNDLLSSLQEHNRILFGLEASNNEHSLEFTESFHMIEADLNVIPNEVEDILKGKYQTYVSTGETPQSRRFSYPTEFAKTASYRRILKEYRSNRTIEDINNLASIPIPDEDLSFNTDCNESTFIDDQITTSHPELLKNSNDCISVSTNGPDSGIVSELNGISEQNTTQKQQTSINDDKPTKVVASLGKCKNSKVHNKKYFKR
ncbi:Kinesin-like protein [Schistosoma japonicum]|uniref:Kinesin-like protein n=1 Tax=Schistosoma japonicum TaxID=6182 RepID=A0A4Z2DUL1_SCHJA|nr:Kinesin-like protein [Schistosoma japonicum]